MFVNRGVCMFACVVVRLFMCLIVCVCVCLMCACYLYI